MSTRILSLATLVVSLLMLVGCSSTPKLEKISVRIKAIAQSSASTTITLLFINPNNVPLVVQETEHTLALEGKPMGHIKNPRPLGIPPLGSVAESFALSAPVAKVVDGFAASHPGSATYVINSTLRITWDNDLHDYKTTDHGSVMLPAAVVRP